MGNTTNIIPVKTDITATYTLTYNDNSVEATANSFATNLPTAVGIKGKTFNIKNSGSGTITVTPDGSETIDGSATKDLAQYEVITVVSNGTNWIIVDNSIDNGGEANPAVVSQAEAEAGTATDERIWTSERVKQAIAAYLIANEMTTKNYALAVAEGEISGYYSVNKFGRTLNADIGIFTDVWDGANPTDDTDIWIAPTTARLHDITSTSTSDTSAGAGAKTIEVYGLTGWGTAEVSETVTMNGTSNVATANSYVIIHRMKVLTKGATDINVGQITATAQTDATVTAIILAGEGQTQMAIYGVPTTQTAYITSWYASTNGSAQVDADVELLWNPTPSTELLNFQIKETQAVRGDGSNYIQRTYNPYYKLEGGGILKVQVSSDTVNADISAGFDLILVDN